MRKVLLTATLLLASTAMLSAAEIRGSYIEARNADIWVAQCFANSEVGIVGDLALMGWKIDKGSWNNVSLDGMGVVAVVRAKSTLGDTFHSAYPTKAILIVDERANMEQRQALQSFVQKMAGDLVQTVVRVESAPIEFNIDGNIHSGSAQLIAGNLARIQTRALREGDAVCHNAITYYPPLSANLEHSMPAHTVANTFSGQGLNVVWSNPDKNSAFLGSFATESD